MLLAKSAAVAAVVVEMLNCCMPNALGSSGIRKCKEEEEASWSVDYRTGSDGSGMYDHAAILEMDVSSKLETAGRCKYSSKCTLLAPAQHCNNRSIFK